ncbi:unnamed protein product [Closterium sp. NIES-54]
MEELELVVLELEAMAREAIELEELELFTLELEVREAMDAEMASWKSTGTYADAVPPSRAYQRQGVDYFHTFSPTPKMTTLRVLLHVAAQRDYELHSLDFSTAFLQGSLHEEIWLSRPPGFTGSFPTGTQWSLRRPVYGLRHAPQEWHDPTRTTLAALGLTPSTANPSLFLRTDTLLPPFYVLAYVDDLVFATADTEALTLVNFDSEYSSQWQTSMDAEMASWKSTSTYVDEVPPPRANIVDGMWIFRVKRPPGSPPAFKARYFARGFSQRQGVHFFQTFSPTPKMTTLWVLLHVAAQRDYELYSLDFSTAFLQGSLHKEIWLCRPPGFTVSFPAGTKWSLWWPVYILHQPPREWHDTLRTTLAALGFAPSSAYPSLFLRTDTTLPQFYVLVYVDDLVFAIADTEALALVKAELHRDTPALTWVLRRFEFQYSSPQPTPLSTGHSLSAPPSDECSSYSC